MAIHLTESTQQAQRFFNILPPDWQESIIPFWPSYQNNARIFVLEKSVEVIGGGIVFSTVSPDTMPYQDEAQKWVDIGYLYIGFLWIDEKYRDQKLGSRWIQEVLKTFPQQAFWLTIDDLKLLPFYERNGFKLIKMVELESHNEWVLATEKLE